MLNVEIIRAEALTTEHTDIWEAMIKATPSFSSPLLHPAFFTEVARVRTDARLAVYTDSASKIVALLPFHQRGKGFARPIGAPFSDYTALITLADFPITGPEALRMAGIHHMPLNGLIDPYGLFSSPDRAADAGFIIDTRLSPLAQNSRNEKKLRRREDKLREDLGPLHYVEDDLNPESFAQLLKWKSAQTRRTGFTDFLAPAWVRQLMRNLFELPRSAHARGQLIGLYAGNRLIAAKFGFRCGAYWHVWLASYDPELRYYSPGLLFFRHLPEVLQHQGIVSCDLATGSAEHKRLFANHAMPVSNGVVHTGLTAGMDSSALPVPSWIKRLGRRLDQIAALEPEPLPRLLSITSALTSAPRRLIHRPAAAKCIRLKTA